MPRDVSVSWYPLAILACLGTVSGAQPVCWQAVLRCQEERDCHWAYGQYSAACEPFLRGLRSQCPSHCIGALVKLNQTRSGPDLESCDCGRDAECWRAKQAIEPCLPRRYRGRWPGAADLGCTAARQRCQEEAACQAALRGYLSRCGQLFNGRRCSALCRASIQRLLALPAGLPLHSCTCDGLERPICQVVKGNMRRFCPLGSRPLLTPSPPGRPAYPPGHSQGNRTKQVGGTDWPLSGCARLGAQAGGTGGCFLLLPLLIPLLNLCFP
ncbi:growth arrest-specific protein 1-like [Mustelus asterias]